MICLSQKSPVKATPFYSLGTRCGEHGQCVGSLRVPTCECNPGWTGQDCSHETMPSTFEPQSYVKYALSFEPDRFTTMIQLRFRTREDHGELFRYSFIFQLVHLGCSHH